jgi:hypothetical protein
MEANNKANYPHIYGGSDAVGALAIKLANASNIQLIIDVIGKGQHFVETLIDRSKGNSVIDYRLQREGYGGSPAKGLCIHRIPFLFTRLQEEWLTRRPYEVISGGLRGIEKGFTDLQ